MYLRRLHRHKRGVLRAAALAVLPAIPLGSSFSQAAHVVATWNAGGVGNWSTAVQWSSNPLVPNNGGGNTFDAVINSDTANVSLDTEITVEGFTLADGTLSGNSTLNVNTSTTWSGGALDGTGTLNLAGTVTMSGVGSLGLSSFHVNLASASTTNWTSGTIVAVSNEGGTFSNLGTFNDTTDDAWTWQSTQTPIFNNLAGATFNKSAGTPLAYQDFQAQFNNTGTVNVSASGLWLSGGGTSTGTFNVSSGATLLLSDFNEAYALAGATITTLQAASLIDSQGTVIFANEFGNANTDVNGAFSSTHTVIDPGGFGHVRFNSGSTFNSAATGDLEVRSGEVHFDTGQSGGIQLSALTLTDGTISGSDDRFIQGAFNWNGGTLSGASTTYLRGPSTLNATQVGVVAHSLENDNSSTVTWTAGELVMNQATITNVVNSTWDAQGNDLMSNAELSAFSYFYNNGAFIKSAGSLTTNIDAVQFDNAGTVDVQIGTLRLGGGGNQSGTFTVAGGATLEFGGGIIALNQTYHELFPGASVSGLTGSTVSVTDDTYIDDGSTFETDTLHVSGYLYGGGTFSSNNAAILNDGFVDVGLPGNWSNTDTIQVGKEGNGVLYVQADGKVSTAITAAGVEAGSFGQVSVLGALSQLDNSSYMQIAVLGSALLEIDGGTITDTVADMAVTGSGSSATANVWNGGKWINSSYLRVGNFGEAFLSVGSGGLVEDTDGILAAQPGSFGVVNLIDAGTTWTNSGYLSIGEFGAGTIDVRGGATVSSSYGVIGGGTGSSGVATISGVGSEWNMTGALAVGNQGAGSLEISEGGVVNNAQAIVASFPAATALVRVTGAGSQWNCGSFLSLANLGAGTVEVLAGGHLTNTDAGIADSAGGTGAIVVDGSGSTWSSSGFASIGNRGTGNMLVTNAGHVTTVGTGQIGSGTGSIGNATISGAGSRWDLESQLAIGVYGAGSMTVSAGAVVTSRKAASATGSAGILGRFGAGVGDALISGAGSRWENLDGSLNVGFGILVPGEPSGGRGALRVTNGGVVTSTDGFIGRLDSGVGTATIGGSGTGSRWDMTGSLYVAGSDTLAAAAGAAGTLVIDVGGTVAAPVLTKVWNNGTILWNAGSLSTAALELTGGGKTLLSSGGNKVLHVATLSVDAPGGSLLDLSDNDMIVGAGTATATVIARIRDARNGGAWDQPGITSSAAQANASHNTTLGVLTGAEYTGVGGAGTFAGQAYVAGDTLVKYTWYGDTDFNGVVGFDDYTRIDQGFNLGRSGWLNGDFDFSGVVGFDDYSLIDLAFNTQSGTLARAISFLSGADTSSNGMDAPSLQMIEAHLDEFGAGYAQAFLAQTPEPASMGALGLAMIATLTPRRRRR